MTSLFRNAARSVEAPAAPSARPASYQTIRTPDSREKPTRLSARDVCVYYGDKLALENISIDIPERSVSALIGPSGCGKSTFLRCLNRMNDTIEGARVTGEITLDGENLYGSNVDVVE